jgi:spoIIIJ-associated protein
MERTHQEIIKEIVLELLRKMDFQAEAEVTMEEDMPQTFLCMARVKSDQNFLIGQHGANLAAIQHIVRMILYKKTEERLNVMVDVNGYLLDKKTLLEQEAEKAAQEAARDQISVMMRPMLPYERKIIHTFLAGNQEVATESIGQGSERKIIIRPKINP